MKTVAILAAADNSAIARVIDCLLGAAACDGEKADELKDLADRLKSFATSHQPNTSTGNTPLLDAAENGGKHK